MLDGSFDEDPLRVYHDLTGTPEQNMMNLSVTLHQIVEHFSWKGVVGCSITKEVAKRLDIVSNDFGVLEKEVGSVLSRQLQGEASFCHTVVHTDAAGYNELVWGGSAGEDRWRGKVVMVCTLGKHLGAVLFNDGRRVRNSPIKTCAELPAPAPNGKFTPPEPGSSDFRTWAEEIDKNLSDMVEAVSTLDRIILLPTGRTSRNLTLPRGLLPVLRRTGEAASRRGCEVAFSDQLEGAVVRGVALCALVELETVQVLRSLDGVLHGAQALHSLSKAQLKVIFDKIDVDCKDGVDMGKMKEALKLLGLQYSIDSLMNHLGDNPTGGVSFNTFMQWWDQEVTRARVVRVTSVDAWKRILEGPPPTGFGELIVLEVTFTFCRSCRSFERVFNRMAEQHHDVRFVQIVGNATIGAMDFCTQELGVKASPAFFVFQRGGKLLAQWSGANEPRFEAKLQECIQAS